MLRRMFDKEKHLIDVDLVLVSMTIFMLLSLLTVLKCTQLVLPSKVSQLLYSAAFPEQMHSSYQEHRGGFPRRALA